MSPDVHSLAASYALDALDEDERAEFEGHLGRCEQCRTEVGEMRATAARLAAAMPIPPRPELRSRVLEAVARTPQAPADPVGPASRRARTVPPSAGAGAVPRRRAAALVAVAAAVALVVGALGAVRLTGGVNEGVDQVAAAPDARQLPLDGAVGTLEVIWSATGGRLAVEGRDLPDPGPGRAYQLWLLGGAQPVPAGVFDPDGAGAVSYAGRLPGEPAGWAVTIEPAAGSAQPTSPIVYQGSL